MGIGSRDGSSLFVVGKKIGAPGYLLLVTIVFAVITGVFYIWLKRKGRGKMDDVIKIEKPPAVSAVRGFSNVVLSQTMIMANSICGLKYVRK